MRRAALAAAEGFADVEHLDVFRCTGPDKEGRPVFMFIPSHLPADADLERVTLYAFSKMHQTIIVEKRDYTALWLCNNGDDSSQLTLRWFWRTFWETPYEYHERLATFCVVHPSLLVRTRMFFLSYVTRSFWEKLDYCDRLEFLDSYVPVALIKTVPDEVKEYDRLLDRDMYSRSDGDLAKLHGMGGIGGMGGMAGMGGLGGAMGGMGGMDGMGVPSAAQDGTEGKSEITLPKRNWED